MDGSGIENDFAEFHLKNGIMFFTYKKDSYLDLEAAMRVVNDRVSIQNGKSYPVLCNITGLKGISKDGRDFLAKEGSELVKAVALIGASPGLRVMTNFYLYVNKPIVPTKVFPSKSEALKYLENYK